MSNFQKSYKIEKNKSREIIEELGFNGKTISFMEEKNIILFDENREKILIIEGDTEKKGQTVSFEYEVIDFEDVLETKVVIDEEVVSSTARGSQIGGAIVGGVLLGGVGAIIGGLSGGRKNKKNIDGITLNIKLDSIERPVINLELMNNRDDKSNYSNFIMVQKINPNTDKGKKKLADILEKVNKCQAIFDVIVNRKTTK